MSTSKKQEKQAMNSKEAKEFNDNHKRRVKALVVDEFPLRVRRFDDMLATPQFSVATLNNLLESCRQVNREQLTVKRPG